jgi:hypothetical protein
MKWTLKKCISNYKPLKAKAMTKKINLNLNLDNLNLDKVKKLIYEGKKAKYLKITVRITDEPDKYGKDVSAYIDLGEGQEPRYIDLGKGMTYDLMSKKKTENQSTDETK